MKKLIHILYISALLLMVFTASGWGQKTVFYDDFSTYNGSTYYTSGQMGGSAFYITRSGNDWGGCRNSFPNLLELTNSVGSTTNDIGWVFAYTQISGFSSPYNAVLKSNTDIITWTFNFKSGRSSALSGFSTTTYYGMALVLVSTSNNPNTSGSGYAVIMGNSPANANAIALISFNDGLQGTRTTVIDFGGAPADLTNYMSVKVTYNPATDEWQLFSRDDGFEWADPATGTMTQIGSKTTNSTYTSTSMSYLGAYWQGGYYSSSQRSYFNRIRVHVGPVLREYIVPRYIQGISGTNTNRVPYVALLSIENLKASSTYRYFNQMVIYSDADGDNGSGNVIFAKTSGDFARATSLSMSNSGEYSEFTSDANGTFKGWFITEPNGDTRFTPDYIVYVRIMLNDGAGGTSVVSRVTSTYGISVKDFGSGTNNLTAIRGQTTGTAKNIILLYDNVDGTGNPLSGTFLESDGTENTTANSYAAFYSDYVNAVAGAWGTVIYNSLTNGVRRVEQRALLNTGLKNPGDLINYETSTDGVWSQIGGGTVNTVNPTGGTTSIGIVNSTLPVNLLSFSSFINGRNVNLKWVTSSEINNEGFFVERSLHGGSLSENWIQVGFVKGSGTKYTPANYSFEDRNLNSGRYVYRLKQVDFNGNFEYFELKNNVVIGVPVKYRLSQNYPNPFNPLTKIDFDIPVKGLVTIKLYDVLSREVSALLNGEMEAGYHTIVFDASKFSSGIYFCRMVSGNYTGVIKMAVLK